MDASDPTASPLPDPDELYHQVRRERRPPSPTRPWLALNMISSVDGAATLDGRSGGLGTPADRALFRVLRATADIVLVGAGTVRAERYGPVRIADELVEARRLAGQDPVPRLAVLSSSAALDPQLPLFTQPGAPPIVFAGSDAPPERLAALGRVSELVTLPGSPLSLAAVLADLRRRGASVVLCEGGPSVNAELLAAGLVDELCLSIAPVLVPDAAPRIVAAEHPLPPIPLELARLYLAEGMLLARYLVRRDDAGSATD